MDNSMKAFSDIPRSIEPISNDSFYTFGENQTTPLSEPMDWGVHNEESSTLPSGQSGGGFQVIICVDGEPYYATIQGSIGAAVT